MHRINIFSVRQLQEQWLELHASVDYNALLFKKYNVNTILTDCIQVGVGSGKL